jgi:NAD(P)-dependent dehydrogenase (short-subunit alcohol dehydrogenase family)
MELRNATVLVTGGSSGIGLSIAKTLIDAGAKVAITGRDEKRLAEAAQSLKALPIRGDVSNEADVLRTYEEVLKAFGHLDVLVNNAGKGIFKPLLDMSRMDYEAVLATNMTGAMMMAPRSGKTFLPGKAAISSTSVDRQPSALPTAPRTTRAKPHSAHDGSLAPSSATQYPVMLVNPRKSLQDLRPRLASQQKTIRRSYAAKISLTP